MVEPMASDPDDDSTFRRPGVENVPTQVSFRLAVVEGPDHARFIDVARSTPMPAVVGTSASAALRLSDKTVSRQHAVLSIEGTRLRVVDRDSTNGTRVNGLEIKEAFLMGGEMVSMGDTVFSLARTLTRYPPERALRGGFGRLVGESEAMQRIYDLCDRAAALDVPTLIEGEAGTGKDLLAECVHEMSARRQGPLIVMSCAGVAPDELARDLFGNDEVPSAFEEATGGTIVLDDIGELDAAMQARLYTVLAERSVRRGRAETPIPVDARLISTSRRNLDRAVEKGLFSAELQAVAVGLRIELPPLRERKGDIALLAGRFWSALGASAPFSSDRLLATTLEESRRGRSNVRELQSYLTRTATFETHSAPAAETRAAEETGLREWMAERGVRGDALEDVLAMDLPFSQARRAAIAAFERRYVERVLAQHRGNVSLASAASGIARRYLQMIKRRTGA